MLKLRKKRNQEGYYELVKGDLKTTSYKIQKGAKAPRFLVNNNLITMCPWLRDVLREYITSNHFAEFVSKFRNDECWLGVGGQSNGYRIITTSVIDPESRIEFGISCRSHIASFYAFNENDTLIPEDKQINHDCQIGGCCRPSHIYLGNSSENNHDAASGRFIVPSHKDSWNIGARMAMLIRYLVFEYKVPTRLLAYCLNKSESSISYVLNSGYQYADTTEFFRLLNNSITYHTWTPEEDKIIMEKFARDKDIAANLGLKRSTIYNRRWYLKKKNRRK